MVMRCFENAVIEEFLHRRADIKQALISGCLLEQLRKESCIKTLGGGKRSVK